MSASTCLIGYGRTSTIEQEAGLEAQRRDLLAAGCETENIFIEQLSSVQKHRPALEEAIRFARRGDVFVVTKLDRLARSVSDLVDLQRQLEAKGVALRILSIDGGGGLDTATPTGKLMVNLLASIAQFEREIMLERQREGIAKAKAEHKYRGRAPTARRKSGAILALRDKGRTVSEIMQELAVGRASVFRVLAEARAATTN